MSFETTTSSISQPWWLDVPRKSASIEINRSGAARKDPTRVVTRPVFKVGIYARVSTHDQQTLPMQLAAMRAYAKRRGWKVAIEEKEVGSGAKTRPKREELLRAARRRDVDAIVVWRLDRWGRSLLDLIGTLQELHTVGVGFVSLTEALDMTTPGGRALAGMLAVFAEFERDILRDRVKAGIAQARKEGRPHGRPPTVRRHAAEIKVLFARGVSKRQIAARLSISRASVRRMLPILRSASQGRRRRAQP
jgi:putative DNA-invertase from lambdoid prophage Rac